MSDCLAVGKQADNTSPADTTAICEDGQPRAEDGPWEQQRHQYQLSQSMATSSPSSATPLDKSNSRLSPTPSIDSLVNKLSNQNLQLDGRDLVQPQLLPTTADLPELPALPGLPTTFEPWPKLEVDDDLEADVYMSELLGRSNPLSLCSSFQLDEGCPIEVDEAEVPLSAPKRLWQRLNHQSQNNGSSSASNNATSNNYPPITSSRAIETQMEDGTQCNVFGRPLPTPLAVTRLAPIIEPDADIELPTVDLEVDEAYCNGNVDNAQEELAMMETIMSLRRAGTPIGIRKYPGSNLRFRLSADAAMKCPNVVRSRPRMRKRTKGRPNSLASSAIGSGVTSAVSSPVIPPSLPSPQLSPQRPTRSHPPGSPSLAPQLSPPHLNLLL
ncbi:hypothetical protein QBC46DRAFT_62727 [Diplogelasinospora grovesii]|uniref:Uncharacterized protein n=1 Tax=Diplogelasinospora grovesii TaxID=303347 RepID=A0AAN6NJE7_9PEZI|nr:hypothetical protein QBC46DRAFT_62727 [Diplogelasinospora grovesii]